jgi:hypothetical protein
VIVAAVTTGREIHAARPDLTLEPNERLIVLAPANEKREHHRPTTAAVSADAEP